MKRTLAWTDICEFASKQFNVWVGGHELEWAQQSWHFITLAGLADYKNEIERHIVLLRLMTLATMYCEFCDLVGNEYFSDRESIYYWFEENETMNPIRIWQITGNNFYTDIDINGLNHDDLLIEAVKQLIDNYREDIYQSLLKGYGADLKIFASMLVTFIEREDGTPYRSFLLSDKELENLFPGDDLGLDYYEELGFYWVSLGIPRSPRENI